MARRSLRPLLLVLLLLGLLAAAGFGVTAGLASGRHANAPASASSKQKRSGPTETLPECEKRLAGQKAVLAKLERLVKDVEAKRTYLINDPVLPLNFGTARWVPVSSGELKEVLTLALFTGKATVAQVAALVRKIKAETAANLAKLKASIESGVLPLIKRTTAECNDLKGGTAPPPKPPPSVGTFTLQPSLTKVTNTHPLELTIDADGRTAHFDNAKISPGFNWQIDFSWKVPETITPGKSIEITLEIELLGVKPSQSLGEQIFVLAPDFAQAVPAHWPDNKKASMTFTVPIAADQKDSSDIAITIGFVSSGVTYHYRK
jgi:hypothetical protein